jgi:Holliday junction resolvasome RuvABC endonuclease subunit
MLVMPSNASRIARIIGIDPGSNTLGVAELSFDVVTLQILNVTATTLTAERHTRHCFNNDIHGDRYSRLCWLEEQLLEIFRISDPFQIALESAFYSKRRPNAFEVLVETRAAILRAVTRWTCWKPIYPIDPPTVKMSVGGTRKSDKDDMKVLVNKMNLPYTGQVPLLDLDEHSIDAIAVAYCHFQQMLKELCLLP